MTANILEIIEETEQKKQLAYMKVSNMMKIKF